MYSASFLSLLSPSIFMSILDFFINIASGIKNSSIGKTPGFSEYARRNFHMLPIHGIKSIRYLNKRGKEKKGRSKKKKNKSCGVTIWKLDNSPVNNDTFQVA